MKVFIIFIIFITYLISQETLSSESIDIQIETNSNIKTHMYSIQLGTFYTVKQAHAFSMFLNDLIRKDIFIYPVDEYITLRYKVENKVRFLKKHLQTIKELGFKDAYIVISKVDKLDKPNKIKKDVFKIETKLINKKTQQKNQKKINRYLYTRILQQAHKYKKNGQLYKSIKRYEQAFEYVKNNISANKNLYYLYGKTNNWKRAEIIFLDMENKDNVLYSYARGALETNSQSLKTDINSYLSYDTSGYTNLILGYYFEKKNDLEKASYYYRKAYNRNNMYVAFAYARFNEIIQKYEKAKSIYKLIYNNTDTQSKSLRIKAYQRYQELSQLGSGE